MKEFDAFDTSGKVHVNIFTKFSSSGGDADSVKRKLCEVLEYVEACTNCILSGNAKNCKFSSSMEVCTRCKTLDWKKSHALVQNAYMFLQTRPLPNARPTSN